SSDFSAAFLPKGCLLESLSTGWLTDALARGTLPTGDFTTARPGGAGFASDFPDAFATGLPTATCGLAPLPDDVNLTGDFGFAAIGFAAAGFAALDGDAFEVDGFDPDVFDIAGFDRVAFAGAFAAGFADGLPDADFGDADTRLRGFADFAATGLLFEADFLPIFFATEMPDPF
ncbi:MAG: hypothetical protein ACTHLN_04520, partial [Tepidisphaeraceae bacterium]